MRRKTRGLAVYGIGAWLVAGLSIGETAEEIVAKNIEARGGLEKIRSVQSMRMTGDMRLGDERLPTVLELKRPGRSRWEFTLEGETAVQAYDGKTAWMIMPFEGQTEPRIMTDQEAKDVELQADMDGPLVDSADKGITIELVGKETIEGGIETWHLRVSRKTGDTRDLYLDAKTYLPVLAVSRRTAEGGTVEIRSRISDYRNVGGLMLPHSFEASASGVPQTQALEFRKIELNVPIEDSRFRMPEPRATPPPPRSTPSAG
jgi:outer membrane lipoprotein-sorting protein